MKPVVQWVTGTVVPVIAGAGAAWLASKGVLNVFDISKATAAADLDELGVFAVVTAAGWLTSHRVLSGHYSVPKWITASASVRSAPPVPRPEA